MDLKIDRKTVAALEKAINICAKEGVALAQELRRAAHRKDSKYKAQVLVNSYIGMITIMKKFEEIWEDEKISSEPESESSEDS